MRKRTGKVMIALIVLCMMSMAVGVALAAPGSALVLPANTKSIEAKAFAGDTSITEVVLPSGISRIGSRAFANCTNLVKINLPESLAGNIALDAFDGCDKNKLVADVTPGGLMQQYCNQCGIYYPGKPEPVRPIVLWARDRNEWDENAFPITVKTTTDAVSLELYADPSLTAPPVKTWSQGDGIDTLYEDMDTIWWETELSMQQWPSGAQYGYYVAQNADGIASKPARVTVIPIVDLGKLDVEPLGRRWGIDRPLITWVEMPEGSGRVARYIRVVDESGLEIHKEAVNRDGTSFQDGVDGVVEYHFEINLPEVGVYTLHVEISEDGSSWYAQSANSVTITAVDGTHLLECEMPDSGWTNAAVSFWPAIVSGSANRLGLFVNGSDEPAEVWREYAIGDELTYTFDEAGEYLVTMKASPDGVDWSDEGVSATLAIADSATRLPVISYASVSSSMGEYTINVETDIPITAVRMSEHGQELMTLTDLTDHEGCVYQKNCVLDGADELHFLTLEASSDGVRFGPAAYCLAVPGSMQRVWTEEQSSWHDGLLLSVHLMNSYDFNSVTSVEVYDQSGALLATVSTNNGTLNNYSGSLDFEFQLPDEQDRTLYFKLIDSQNTVKLVETTESVKFGSANDIPDTDLAHFTSFNEMKDALGSMDWKLGKAYDAETHELFERYGRTPDGGTTMLYDIEDWYEDYVTGYCVSGEIDYTLCGMKVGMARAASIAAAKDFGLTMRAGTNSLQDDTLVYFMEGEGDWFAVVELEEDVVTRIFYGEGPH